MAVTTTPLGFKKPDGNELARNGDNVIADNAQVAQDILGDALPKLASATAAVTRIDSFESQIAGLSAQVSAVSTPFNIGIDLDGTPYFDNGATGLALAADTDGVPYFL